MDESIKEQFKKAYTEEIQPLLGGRSYWNLSDIERLEIRQLALDVALDKFPELRKENPVHINGMMGRLTQTIFGQRKGKSLQMPLPAVKHNGNGNGNGNKKNIDNDTSSSASGKYRVFIDENDLIPSDKDVAYFLGVTPTLPYGIRKEYRQKGFEFEKLEDARWKVTKRPLPPVAPTVPVLSPLSPGKLSFPDINSKDFAALVAKIIDEILSNRARQN